MRFAYADPPYIGQARNHYSHDPLCAEVDHADLICRLDGEYDGWALSMSATMRSLKTIVPLAPDRARFGAWCKPFASFKRGVSVAYTWEPVLFYSPRPWFHDVDTVKDHIIEAAPCVVDSITMMRGLSGVKPDRFCVWLFDILGMTSGDEFCDLFPGSGAVRRAWEAWTNSAPSGVQQDAFAAAGEEQK